MSATKGSFYYGKPIKGHEQHPHLDAGDDAVPYLGNCLISVADGTGARSGGPQLHINRQLLRADASFDAALRDCLGKHPEDYLAQYEENFRYLLAVGGDYDRVLPRKSGYFGSRLTSIIMRRLVEDKCFGEEGIERLGNGFACAVADGDGSLFDLFCTDDKHIRHLLHLRCADLVADGVGRIVKLNAQSCGRETVAHLCGVLDVLVTDGKHADLLGSQPQRERTCVFFDQECQRALVAAH